MPPPLTKASILDHRPVQQTRQAVGIRVRVEHEATMHSTMLDVKIDRSEPIPLHDQVAGEIRRAIADGEAIPGERLPPARDFAAVLGVNTNTVLRALRLLRDEGLVEFRRGRTIRVSGTPQRSAVLTRTKELVQFARQHGYRTEELVEMIQSLTGQTPTRPTRGA